MRYQQGFGYLGILFAVAIGGVALASIGSLWSLERQREKETELLAIGMEFQRAIGLYYERSPGAVKRYPKSLNELLKDDRFLATQRYLRQIYVDPIAGTREWGIVQAPEGGVMGVHSLSRERPFKQSSFPLALSELDRKVAYSDWRFVYRPLSTGWNAQ